MILRVLTKDIFNGVFSEELIKELCPDSEMIKFTHTNITTEKGQFLLVNFLNNSNVVLSAKLNKTDISDFIKELSYCENNDTILNIKLSESSSWFINFAIASMTKKDVDKLIKRKNKEKKYCTLEDNATVFDTVEEVIEDYLSSVLNGFDNEERKTIFYNKNGKKCLDIDIYTATPYEDYIPADLIKEHLNESAYDQCERAENYLDDININLLQKYLDNMWKNFKENQKIDPPYYIIDETKFTSYRVYIDDEDDMIDFEEINPKVVLDLF